MSVLTLILKKLRKFQLPYEFFMALLAFLSLYFYYFAFHDRLTPAELRLAHVIEYVALAIFAVDYVVRLALAKDKKDFFLYNILDLLALFPMSPLFRGLRLVRCAILLARFFKRIRYFGTVNMFIYILIASIVILMTSALVIAPVEGFSYGEALWWGIETIATVGYGDISPQTPIGRVVATVLMFIGIGLLSFLTSAVTTYYVNRHYEQSGLRAPRNRSILWHYQKALMQFDHMTLQDIDDMYHALRALKECELSVNQAASAALEDSSSSSSNGTAS